MPRQFNTAGPNVAADHYTLPPLERQMGWLSRTKFNAAHQLVESGGPGPMPIGQDARH